jgi:hypothetical protein
MMLARVTRATHSPHVKLHHLMDRTYARVRLAGRGLTAKRTLMSAPPVSNYALILVGAVSKERGEM